MKTRFLLITISCITLVLFSSCKTEFDRDITGGGMQNENAISRSVTSPKAIETIFVPDVILKAD